MPPHFATEERRFERAGVIIAFVGRAPAMSTLGVLPMADGPCCVEVTVLVFGESIGAWD